jgi:hypothetical protein
VQTRLTLYLRYEEPIELVIQYLPALDGAQCEGWWNVDHNVIALSWRMYSQFQKIEKQSEKKAFFQSLRKISGTQIS